MNPEKLDAPLRREVVLREVTSLATTNKEPTPVPERDSAEDCSEIMSLSIAANTETTGVTTFESEACQQVEVLGAHHYHPKLSPLQPDIQNLTDYFSRPRLIFSATIPTGQAPVWSAQFNNNTIFTTVFPDGFRRLKGVYGVRFTMVFTYQLATTPFHQGVLVANWQYGPAATVALPTSALTPRTTTLGMQTNVPHVLMDVASTTMAVLKIPYLAVPEFYPLTDDYTTYGHAAVIPLLPVTSGVGTAPPTIRIYMHLEDLELIGAVPDETATLVLQAGKKVSPVTSEFNQESKPFSSALNSAGMALSYLAKGIPSLSSLAGPPAWFLGQAARLARFYGFSKPTIVDPPQRMYITSNVDEFNVDKASLTSVVGPFAENTLAVSPEFAHNDVDEMSFEYITSQYSQICIGKMETTDASTTPLYATAVSPSSFWFRSRLTGAAPFCNVGAPKSSLVNDTPRGFIPSNIFFLASCFKEWKGSFRFRFTFAKTKFHGGRVFVQYNPTYYSSDGDITYFSDTPSTVVSLPSGGFGLQPFGYSKLFDLRDSNVFEFDVPYISAKPYNSFFGDIGSLVMYVQDPLIAPATVPSSVPFCVEVKAMPDFEVAIPVSPAYPPVTIADATTSNVRYQSGKLVSMSRQQDSQLCIGEKMLSVKQMISVPKVSYGGTILANTVDSMTLMPWWYGPMYNFTTPANAPFLREMFGFGFYFSQAYTFVKGGTDYHFYPGNSSMAGTMITVSQISPTPGMPAGAGFPNNTPFSSNARVFQDNMTVGTHVRLPAYQKYARYLSSVLGTLSWYPALNDPNSTVQIPYTRDGPLVQYTANVINFSTGTTQLRISRNAADDAGLGMYIGPPILGLLPPNNPNGAYDLDSTSLL